MFDEWQALKRKVSKGCTQRMVDAIVREAGKAGITPEAAMIYQLEHGWTGFEAEWYLNKQQRTASTTNAQRKRNDLIVEVNPDDYTEFNPYETYADGQ